MTGVKALILVDVQNDFIDGSLAVTGGEEAAARCQVLSHSEEYDVVVTTQDWHYQPGDHFSDTPDYKDTWPVHCKAGTWGAQLSSRLDSARIDEKFFKGQYAAAYSGFEGVARHDGFLGGKNGLDLEEFLSRKGVVEVDVVGIATDYCVKATALDSAKAGFRTRVLIPYCAAVSAETDVAARAEMTQAKVDVVEVAA
jgi:nicotinamidase/pyrazinamidase